MLVYVYKSLRKQDTYLYVSKKDDFSVLPDMLLKTFGPPQFLTVLATQKHQQIGLVDKQKLIDELTQKGFLLQLPPPVENLLKEHVRSSQQQMKKGNEKTDG